MEIIRSGDAGKTVRRVWIPEPDEVPVAEPAPAIEPAAEPEPVPA